MKGADQGSRMFGPKHAVTAAKDGPPAAGSVRRLFPMQNYIASVVTQVAEFGVFFAAAAALTAGALALR